MQTTVGVLDKENADPLDAAKKLVRAQLHRSNLVRRCYYLGEGEGDGRAAHFGITL